MTGIRRIQMEAALIISLSIVSIGLIAKLLDYKIKSVIRENKWAAILDALKSYDPDIRAEARKAAMRVSRLIG